MRTLAGIIVLCIACGCTGTRTGNPGNSDVPEGIVVAQSKLAREDAKPLAEASATMFGKDNRAFALALYRELAAKPGNLFFSPYSISTALAMTYAGAKGQTATEMASALHFTLEQAELHAAFNAADQDLAKRKDQLVMSSGDSPTTGTGFELRVVNKAWGQIGQMFVPSYLDVLAANYGAGMFLIDFEQTGKARTVINDWVAEQTEDRIRDLLPENAISPDVKLVLTNAIYFKASWFDEFEVADTKTETFNAAAGARSVQMMHAMRDTTYAEVDGFQAVKLPYISTSVHMLLILPPAGPFDQAIERFDAARFEALRARLSRHIVTLSLPKWSFESENPLKAPLRALGMNLAFTNAADFSGMTGEPELMIDDVYHKAFVAVDEKGTEAAAATAVVAVAVSLPPSATVVFNRPFMFLVYDEPTGQILFLGHLADPG